MASMVMGHPLVARSLVEPGAATAVRRGATLLTVLLGTHSFP